MDKKILLALIAFCSMQLAFADTCPTVTDIKTHKAIGWKAYDSESGKPLSKKRATNFIASINQFTLAEWSNHGEKKTFIRCFYRDLDGSDQEAYLTKDNLVPEQSKKWYRVSGAMQCAAGSTMCKFAHIKDQPRLAKK